MRTLNPESAYRIWEDAVYRILTTHRIAHRYSIDYARLKALHARNLSPRQAADAYVKS